jgi:multidrug efflux system outer membrane protein
MRPKPYQPLIILALLCLATPSPAEIAATYSLGQSLSEGILQSTQLRAQAQQLAAARAGAREARASRLPRIDASGTYNYTSTVPKFDITLPPPVNQTFSRTIGDGNMYDFNVGAHAVLYSGGSLVERQHAARSGAEAARQDLMVDSLQLSWTIRRTFFNAMNTAKREDIARQSVSRLNRHLTELKGAKEIGMASEEMIIQTESRLRQAEALAINAAADARAARLALGDVVGRPGEEIAPADELDTPLSGLETTDIEKRADLGAINARINQSGYRVKAARGSYLPMLSAQAMYHYAKPGVDQFTNEWMDYGTVGVNLTWTLWDWNSRRYQVDQTRAGMNALKSQRDQLLRSVQTRMATAEQNVSAAKDALVKSTEHRELEQRRFQLVQGRYQVGASSESEFLDAQDDLTVAQLDQATSTVRLRLAEADWIYAAGK